MAETKTERKKVRKQISIQIDATIIAPEGPDHGQQVITLSRGPILSNIARRADQLDWSVENLEMAVMAEEIEELSEEDSAE